MVKVMSEIWRDIAGYEGLYQVSNMGRVRSIDHIVKTKTGKDMFVKGMMKKPTTYKGGYQYVNLQHRKKKKMFQVHRLVAAAFIPNPDNKPEVNHIDAVKDNNCVSNLEWVTGEENNKHAIDNGLIKTTGTFVMMDDDITFESINKCAKYVGVDPHEIRRALKGEYKTVHGHYFKEISV